jgi:hypothetical protein
LIQYTTHCFGDDVEQTDRRAVEAIIFELHFVDADRAR